MSSETSRQPLDTADASEKKQPVAKKQYGAVTISIWEHETNDRMRLFHNWTIQRSYQDEGAWHNTGTFRPADTLDAIMLFFWAHRWIRSEGKQRVREFGQRTGSSEMQDDDVPF